MTPEYDKSYLHDHEMTPGELNELSHHVDALRRHKSLRLTKQGRLLAFMLECLQSGPDGRPRHFVSSEAFFKAFRKALPSENPGENGPLKNGQQMIHSLREALDKAYAKLPFAATTSRRLCVEQSPNGGYRLEWEPFQAEISAAYRSSDGDLVPLGTIEAAIDEYAKLASEAHKIEDTTVRWHKGASLYSQHAINKIRAALTANTKLDFHSITGPIVEQKFMEALAEAFEGRLHKLKCKRLPQVSPLMNFVIFYLDGPKEKVLFGYGKQTGSVEETGVFSSTNKELIKEFQRLFRILEHDDNSRPIGVNDPEFNVKRGIKNDILASFDSLPMEEIGTRIKTSRRHVSICIAGWSILDLYSGDIEQALRNGAKVSIGLWDAESEFVTAMSYGRNLANMSETIQNNLHTLEKIKKDDAASHKISVELLGGWGSMPIFWIDDYIYFGGYWKQHSAMRGPVFFVHESSVTGEFLGEEFRSMMRSKRQIGS